MYSVSIIDYNGTPTETTPTPVNKELYIYDNLTNDEGHILIEPSLSLEISKAGSFSCSLPETNYGYGRIIRKRTRVVVRKNNKVIFMGRINSEDRDIYLTQKIVAEGALAYLGDTLTEKKVFSYKTLPEILSDIFTHHNSKFSTEPWKQFHFNSNNCKAMFVGYDDTDVTSDKLSSFSINFDTTLNVIESLLSIAESVIKIEYDETNGYWEVYIYKKYELPEISTQPIEFGVNLLDLIQSYDSANIVTAVAPFGGEAIQTSKEIGEVVASNDINTYVEGVDVEISPGVWIKDIYNHCMLRAENDPDYNYGVFSVRDDPVYTGSGYWAFCFNIAAYNAAHLGSPLKRLYLSWRALKFKTIDEYGEETGYIADNAWRIFERIWDENEGKYIYQTLGYHELTNDNGDFESDINEVIDLTNPQYTGANYIMMGGWGGLITPLIRRDATVVEEADKLNISGCAAFNTDSDGLRHPEGDFYLYSDTLINSYGLIEKKLEYDIEDKSIPLTSYVPGLNPAPYGGITQYDNCALGYEIIYEENENNELVPNYEFNKGLYNVIPFASDGAYTCLEYELPDLGSPVRPRGVFITTRMHDDGNETIYGDKNWKLNGMYVIMDESDQVLAYKSAQSSEKDIDLSDPKYYGAKKIRVGGYTGGEYGIELYPSDDNYSRNRLMDQGKLYLTSYQWEKTVIEATAVDLSMTSNEWENLDICTNAKVISDFHGIETTLQITALDIQLDDIENNSSIKLGYDNDEYLTSQLSEEARLSAIYTSTQGGKN